MQWFKWTKIKDNLKFSSRASRWTGSCVCWTRSVLDCADAEDPPRHTHTAPRPPRPVWSHQDSHPGGLPLQFLSSWTHRVLKGQLASYLSIASSRNSIYIRVQRCPKYRSHLCRPPSLRSWPRYSLLVLWSLPLDVFRVIPSRRVFQSTQTPHYKKYNYQHPNLHSLIKIPFTYLKVRFFDP